MLLCLLTTSCAPSTTGKHTVAPAAEATTPAADSNRTGTEAEADAGGVGGAEADYVDPDEVIAPLPTPEPDPPGLDDPASHGLTVGDETAALAIAQEFVTTIWTWDYTDDTDRAGLIRALALTTPELQQQLQPWVEEPLYGPQQWQQLAAAAGIGSTAEVLTAAPAPEGAFDADTYTVQLIYRTFTFTEQGYYTARDEDPRYATVQLTRTPGDGWLVAAMPNLEAEQVIERPSP
ncbi:hypothetical protein [Pseudactinotalea sp.]|uniref:hypothetical protein n=1 Tax=Pseudactinotalea sp. TaxID=1926260 RepID=UPI003B3A7982